jgi:hypothetical protein
MLQGNVANFLAAMGDVRERNALMKVLQNIADRMSCVWFNSPAPTSATIPTPCKTS